MMNYTINITNARKDLYKLTDMVIDTGAVVNISTKNGNAILISEEEYNSLIETIELSKNEGYKNSLIEGKNTKTEELVDEDDIKW